MLDALQVVLLAMGTALALATAYVTRSDRREERREVRRRDVEQHLVGVVDRLLDLADAAAHHLTAGPPYFHTARLRLRAALAMLTSGPSLPKCQALVRADADTVTRTVDDALDEVVVELHEVRWPYGPLRSDRPAPR